MAARAMIDHALRRVRGLPRDATPVQLIAGTVDMLHELVDFQACANTTLDPTSLLPSAGAHIEGFPATSCGPYWDAEFLRPDVLTFGALHRSGQGSGTLHRATDGRPDTSLRHRDVYRPLGLDAELRAMCTVDGITFGALDLLRGDGEPDFGDDDLRIVDAVTPELASRLRRTIATSALRAADAGADGQDLDAAVVILDDDGGVMSMTASAQEMLDRIPEPLRGGSTSIGRLAGIVHAIWARARFIAAGFAAPAATARVRLRDGRWMTLTGTCTRTPDGGMGHTVVVLEPTPRSQLGPLVLAAHGLTPREEEVVGLLLRGDSAQQISSWLRISVHTVRTHVKRIHEKMGISSRAELTRLFIDEEFLPNGEIIGH